MSPGESLPSNWGRWGDHDERGTLNLIDDAARARAAAEVRTGRSVPLARMTTLVPVMSGPMAPETQPGSGIQQVMMNTGSPPMATGELLLVTVHHPTLTHLDAVAHMVLDGLVYPGRPLAESVGPAGVTHGSTRAFADGVVTRGVLLDLAPGDTLQLGHQVSADDLERAETHAGVTVTPGDAVVLRSGRDHADRGNRPQIGLSVDAVRWMGARDVSLYLGDVGDSFTPGGPLPLHQIALARLGMPLVDVPEIEALARLCAELGRYTFLLTVAPPRISGATGVPVNPLAIF